MSDTNEYLVDVHLIRMGADYKSDVFEKLVVNGADTSIQADMWTVALRDWLNKEFHLETKARSMTSIEGALMQGAGRRIAFVEQGYDGEHVVRRYKISSLEPIEKKYAVRHSIARIASAIVDLALDDDLDDVEMARKIESFCSSILIETAIWEGKSPVTRHTGKTITEGRGQFYEANAQLKRGDMVVHPKFGLGRVYSIAPDGIDLKLVITFETWGVKTFAASFTPLNLAGGLQSVPDSLLFREERKGMAG